VVSLFDIDVGAGKARHPQIGYQAVLMHQQQQQQQQQGQQQQQRQR